MSARKVLVAGLIALLAAMTVSVHFFHAEKGLGGDASCPACRLQASSLAVHEVDGIVAPRFQILDFVSVLEYAGYAALAARAFETRGPPSA
jgi:hypothetical protein